jgi:non-specific protein-tyrosine kinase
VDTSAGDLSLLDYVRPVWRFKWLVLLVVVLAAGGTYLAFRHGTTKYVATTQLYVGATASSALGNPNAGFIAPSVFAQDVSLASTPEVAARVISDLHLPTSPAALLSTLTVVSDSTSDSMTLVVTAPQPQLAVNLVNGFARAYLEVSTQAARAYEQSQIKSVRQQLTLHMSASQRAVLTNELDNLEAQAALPPQIGEQVSSAAGAIALRPNPKRDALFAGALALLLALIACYVFDRSDRRLRRLEDIERLLGVPVLATIPHVRRADPSNGDRAATVVALREPYRTLRVNLDMIRLQEGVRTIMVTSALPSEGKTTVVRNLALAYREAGLSVAIIEGDMRRPVLASLFGVPRSSERGLSEILEDRDEVGSALVTVAGSGGSERIDLLPAGKTPENPTALLGPEAFRAVRNQLLADHALVLVDSPPILAVSDALVMAGQVDGVLLVVRAAVSTDATVKRLRHAVGKVPDTKILGAVANAVSDDLGYASSYYLPSPYEPFETPSLQE